MELLIQELRLQREAQLRHFEGLDTKAGIVLGFAGVIATLSPPGGAVGTAGRAFAIAAAVLALASFIPRDFPLFRSSVLVHALIGQGIPPNEQRHVDVLIWSLDRARIELRAKSRALALAVIFIVSATVLLGGAIIGAGGSR